MKNIIIRIRPGAPEQVALAEQATDGSLTVREGALADLARFRGRRRVIVLVPAAEVLLAQTPLPPGSRKRALMAIPFVLEEYLAADVEDLHFAYGAKQADGTMPVAVVAHARMNAWLAMFKEAGIEVDSLIPETIAVPLEPSSWSVLIEDRLAIVRTGLASGYAVDIENLETMLLAGLKSAAAGNPDNDIRIQLFGGSLEIFTDPLLRDRVIQVAAASVNPPDIVRILAAGLASRPLFNLLQGSYGPHAEWGMVLKRWRLPAVLLLCLLVLRAGLFAYDVLRLGYESRDLSRKMDQVFLKAFPDVKRIVNSRAQMEQRLKALKGSDDDQDPFLWILGRCGDALLKTPDFDLESLRYKDGRIEIDFAVRDLQVLDGLKTLLMRQGGLEVEIRTATAKGDRVQTRMLIREKNS